MLVRLDPDKATTLLSVPRDLKVTIYPRHSRPTTQKINAAYTIGGVKLAVATIKRVLGIRINHVVDVNFKGFGQAVDTIGCVYVDVDRRYYNDNAGTGPGQHYATINIRPGYQRLCGQNALDYARFRHTDTDLVRAARQQGFLRQAKQQVGVAGLIDKRATLERIFGRNTQTDVHSTTQVLRLLKLLLVSLGHPVRQIHFQARLGPSYVTANPQQIHGVVREFLHGGAIATARPHHGRRNRHPRRRVKPSGGGLTAATLADQTLGHAAARHVHFPLCFPKKLLTGSGAEQLRVYRLHDEQGKLHHAYRIVVPRGLVGEYYGLEGTDWLNPPILTQPGETRRIHGREYQLFYDGSHLQYVAWRASGAAYWISNTLTEDLSNEQILAIARSARPLR
jgi:LCP family protein required for cell wall assembly